MTLAQENRSRLQRLQSQQVNFGTALADQWQAMLLEAVAEEVLGPGGMEQVKDKYERWLSKTIDQTEALVARSKITVAGRTNGSS